MLLGINSLWVALHELLLHLLELHWVTLWHHLHHRKELFHLICHVIWHSLRGDFQLLGLVCGGLCRLFDNFLRVLRDHGCFGRFLHDLSLNCLDFIIKGGIWFCFGILNRIWFGWFRHYSLSANLFTLFLFVLGWAGQFLFFLNLLDLFLNLLGLFRPFWFWISNAAFSFWFESNHSLLHVFSTEHWSPIISLVFCVTHLINLFNLSAFNSTPNMETRRACLVITLDANTSINSTFKAF